MEPNSATYMRTVRRNTISNPSFGTRRHNSVISVVLPLDDEKSRIKVSLDKLSYLKAGWDGLEALPIAKKVIANVSHLLATSDNLDWKGWAIEPNINGTVILRSNSRRSCVSLGADSFSFFIKNGKDVEGQDEVCFTSETVLSVMRSVNKLTEWKHRLPCGRFY